MIRSVRGRDNPSSEREASTPLWRTSVGLLPAQLLLRGIEGLLPLALAYWFGRSDRTDVLLFSWAWFTLAGSLLYGCFHDSALIPVLIGLPSAQRPRFLGSVLAHAVLLGVLLAAGIAGAAALMFAFRYGPEERALAATLLLPFGGHLVLISVRLFFGAILNAAGRFQVPAWASGLGMAAAIGIVAAFHDRGVAVVPVALMLGEALGGALCAWAVVRGLGVRLELTLQRPPPMGELARLLGAEVGGQAISRLNPVVDQLTASFSLIVGAGTLIRYANDVAFVPTSLLQAVVLSVLLSRLSAHAADGDLEAVRRSVRRTIAAVVPILVAAGALLYLFRRPLLRVLFQRGEMDAGGVAEMAAIFPWYLLGLPSFGVLLIVTRATTAIKDSRILPWTGALNVVATALFDFVCFGIWGLTGIAVARTLASTLTAGVLWWKLEQRLRS